MIKKNTAQTGIALALLVVLLIGFTVWSSNHRANKPLPAAEAGAEITHVTSGFIAADQAVAVRFANPQVSPNAVEKPLSPNPFTFTPHIDGKAFWQDPQTLVFQPSAPLYEKQYYHARLDLKETQLEFHFATTGQNVLAVGGLFELVSAGSSQEVYFSGTVQLAEKVSAELLKQGLKLELDGKFLNYELTSEDNYSFTIKSQPIARNQSDDRKLTVLIAASPLKLASDIRETFYLTGVESSFRALRIEEEKLDQFSQLRVIFSEPLNPRLDYRGYVHLTPSIDCQVAVDGNSLVISGPFRPREMYQVRLFPGIESTYGQKLADTADFVWDVSISDRNPVVEFVDSGMILPSTNEKKLVFRTINVARLRLQVKKVKEDNLIAFFEENSYRPHSYSYDDYNYYAFQRHGEIIADQIVEIGDEANKWIQTELDLSRIIKDNDPALYVVQLGFDANQVLYLSEEYHDWYGASYLNQYGRAVKHLLVSDIGITARQLEDELHVFLTDIVTTEPIADAVVMLKDAGGKVIRTAYSNTSGWAVLNTDSTARYVEVRTGNDFAVMSLGASLVNQSIFDIGGVQKQDGINAFIYTERGVYRPGEAVHLAAIVRNDQDTFPDRHPVTLRVYNPLERLVYEAVDNSGSDGFYAFEFQTDTDAPTGIWTAVLDVGGRLFTHEIRVETIVPYRIEVAVEPEKERLSADDQLLPFAISSQYLFGAPGSGLESETTVTLEPYPMTFAGYSGFTFDNPALDFKPLISNVHTTVLDENGRAKLVWHKPEFGPVPSALRLRIDTKVLEAGGRAVPAVRLIPVEHYPSYVGIMELEEAEVAMGQKTKFVIAHVSATGDPIPDSQLEYKFYHSRQYWWWEYGSFDSFRRYYKTSEHTEVLEQGTVVTNQAGLAELEIAVRDYGEVLLEVTDPKGGHSAGYFFRSYWWASGDQKQSADIVLLKLDKAQYLPGETAKVSLSTPARGRMLVTVEKEGRILHQSWLELTSNETSFEIDVKQEYIPNAYLSVVIYQPYGGMDNDLPLRMYGVVPLYVTSEGAQIELNLAVPETVRPEEEFILKVQTADGEPCQFTVAVVDEGLLNITGYATPDPLGFFFAKQRLLSKAYDNFADIINLTYGYIHNHLSIGGDGAPDYRQLQVPKEDPGQFETVSLFYGPFSTDAGGYAEVPIKLPNYIGSVRIMVVAASKGRYGSAEKQAAVKAPVMVMPTLPRVLGPEDRIRVPVTVFTMEEGLGEIDVHLDVSGPAEIIGPDTLVVDPGSRDRTDVFFELAAAGTVGTVEITVSASSRLQGYTNRSTALIPVRPDNPYIYLVDEQMVDPGETVVFAIPERGVPGTDATRLVVSSVRGLNLNHRLKWLIRYPYGCIEQITSGVFPQLYLADLYPVSKEELMEIDGNINGVIAAYSRYQLVNGAFAYWPDSSAADHWATNYAGHFLLEAKAKGYHVPAQMLERWIRYQAEAAKANAGTQLTRAYRLYLLALADAPVLSAMNYMRESELDKLDNTARFYLGGAYYLMGYKQIGESILAGADISAPEYVEFGGTYGSTLRDQAIMLDILTLVRDFERGSALYNQIAEAVSSPRWYSTQTTGYALLALAKYVAAVKTVETELTGIVTFADQSRLELVVSDLVGLVGLDPQDGGGRISFTNTASVPVFAALEWEGIPKRGELEPEAKNLILKTDYYDQWGNPVDISRLTQGDTFYAVFHVDHEADMDIYELALVQVLPAGWEIENLRVTQGTLPLWTERFNLGHEEYVDIRDDRIMWFFDRMQWDPGYDFIVKINAVTVGQFYLPPTLLEAMYNNDYKVTTSGQAVEVVPR